MLSRAGRRLEAQCGCKNMNNDGKKKEKKTWKRQKKKKKKNKNKNNNNDNDNNNRNNNLLLVVHSGLPMRGYILRVFGALHPRAKTSLRKHRCVAAALQEYKSFEGR